MEPDWTRFESSYKSKVNISMVNVLDQDSPEMKSYGQLVVRGGNAIPLTVWLDASGRPAAGHVGMMTDKELGAQTDAVSKNSASPKH